MGLRGPQPKPDRLKALEGNPGRRPLNLSDGINPEVSIPDPPTWLCKDGLKEWKRFTAELLALGLISKLDRTGLSLYCQSYGELCLLQRAFAATQKRLVEKGREVGMDVDEAASRSFFAQTPSGIVRPAPLYRQIVELREECDRYVSKFFGSPSARVRMKPSDESQLTLPGLAANDGEPPVSGLGRFNFA